MDGPTAACVRAERAVSLALGGNCTIPLGAYAQPEGSQIRLRAIVAAPDGRRIARADCTGSEADPEALGRRAAEDLRRGGAEEILRSIGK
jgi:hydroxymethylbilane synthase